MNIHLVYIVKNFTDCTKTWLVGHLLGRIDKNSKHLGHPI